MKTKRSANLQAPRQSLSNTIAHLSTTRLDISAQWRRRNILLKAISICANHNAGDFMLHGSGSMFNVTITIPAFNDAKKLGGYIPLGSGRHGLEGLRSVQQRAFKSWFKPYTGHGGHRSSSRHYQPDRAVSLPILQAHTMPCTIQWANGLRGPRWQCNLRMAVSDLISSMDGFRQAKSTSEAKQRKCSPANRRMTNGSTFDSLIS